MTLFERMETYSYNKETLRTEKRMKTFFVSQNFVMLSYIMILLDLCLWLMVATRQKNFLRVV